MMESWRAKTFREHSIEHELPSWLNEIERELNPATDYFFLDKLIQLTNSHLLLALVVITKHGDENHE